MNLHASPRHATDALLSQPNLRLRIGEHVIDVGALRLVTRPDVPRLTHKAVAVLIELVRQVGKTVTRDELLDRVWAGRFTTPDVLTQVIKELRRAFADDGKPPQYIETIPKVGYRLIAPVLVLDGPDGGIFVESDASRVASNGHGLDATTDFADSAAARAARALSKNKWLAAAALAALGIGLAWWRVSGNRTHEAPAASAQGSWKAVGQRSLTSFPGPERRPGIAPDGTRIAFGMHDAQSNVDRIFVRSIDDSQLVHLTVGASRHEVSPVWSPDGTRIAFERLGPNECAMFVASSLGGGEREIGPCRNDYIINYYDWTPDGKDLITAQPKADGNDALTLMRLSLDTGEKVFLDYRRESTDVDLEPHYSPDGRLLAFRRGLAPYSDLFVMDAAGGSPRQVTHISARIRGYTWTRDGRALVLATDFNGPMSLYATDIADGVLQPLGISPATSPHAARSADGVVYEIPRTSDALAYVPITPGVDADPQPLAASTGSDYMGSLSPTGDRIVFASDRSGRPELWLYDRAMRTATPLTNGAGVGVFCPRWSSDGKRVIAIEHLAEGQRLIEIDVATRRKRVLSKAGQNVLFGGYGVDADTYLVAVGPSIRDSALFLVAHAGTANEESRLLVRGVSHAEVDPAARLIYYVSVEHGLFRRGLDDAPPTFITPKVNLVTLNGWRIVDGRVWYITGLGDKPAILHEIDPATAAEREIARLNVALRDVSFSVTPARDGVIVTPVGVEDTDVGMFELARSPGR